MCARYWLLKAKRLTLERRVILEGHGGVSGRGCDEWSSEYVAGRCRLHVIAICCATREGYAMYETVVYSEVVAVVVSICRCLVVVVVPCQDQMTSRARRPA